MWPIIVFKRICLIFYIANSCNKPKILITQKSFSPKRTIILRAGGSNVKYRIRDELFQELYKEIEGIGSAYIPAIIFINGNMWGIYNIREQINTEFLEKKFGKAEYQLLESKNLLENKQKRKSPIKKIKNLNPNTVIGFNQIKDNIDIYNSINTKGIHYQKNI